ncbi:MAG TPA: GNAT family N-acetyltransferase, partial [Nitrososphaeraceae archaeon]|nr:GNAT family N-acetyltransferase [Nitrososphaeraceae archaeon]
FYVNADFPGDYFFNKTKILSPCSNTHLLITQAKRIFFSNKLDCFIHSHEGLEFENTNNILEDAGFSCVDTMLIFSTGQDTLHITESKSRYETDLVQILTVDKESVSIWVDVFCKAFNAEDWYSQIYNVTATNYSRFNLQLLMIRSDSVFVPAACTLLFCHKKVLGLYCLGTLPKFRRKGLASQILKSSILTARDKGMKLFFAQSFMNDGYATMYNKAGLDMEYKRRVYALYRGQGC